MLREPQGYHTLECCRIKTKQIVLSFSVPGLARAGESPASRKRARRPPCLRGPARRPTGARGCGPGLGPPLLTFQLLFFFFSFPPFPSAGLTDQSERRWRWSRKLGRRFYCSPLGSGESLSLSSKRAKKAGLPAPHRRGGSLLQHHYRHCEDITPESRSSALRNDNFPTILEAREGGPGGEVPPRPTECKLLLLISGKKSTPAACPGTWGTSREGSGGA